MVTEEPEYLDSEVLDLFLRHLEEVIKLSLKYGLKVHSSVGGKYGELWVAKELLKFKPLLADWRYKSKTKVNKPASADILLEKTKKKVEVKWGMMHYDKERDPFAKGCQIVPCWGWGFGEGQVKESKFDYLVLIAAEKDAARPKYVFVIKKNEINKETMGGPRRSGVGKNNYYIEYSDDPRFYYERKWYKGPSPIEKVIHENKDKYLQRWNELKHYGFLR